MLDGFIPSKTRINILVRLFLNPATKAYLRQLANEFGVSTNSVRTELNHLKEHQLLNSERSGRNVLYYANPGHPLFPELSSMVRKVTGIDQLVASVTKRLGALEAAYLVGDYAQGKDTGVIDVVLVGTISPSHLDDMIRKTEAYIQRKIRPLVTTRGEYLALRQKGAIAHWVRLWERPAATVVSAREDVPLTEDLGRFRAQRASVSDLAVGPGGLDPD